MSKKSEKNENGEKTASKTESREARLKAALRANLRRRKAASRKPDKADPPNDRSSD